MDKSRERQPMRSKVAQWWSTRLLTDRLWVRAPPLEPFFKAAGVAELADAQDLKSCDLYRSYRFDPGLRHHKISYRRGVEQLVARRAHNPEVAGSSPVPATKQISCNHIDCRFFYFIGNVFSYHNMYFSSTSTAVSGLLK